VTALHFRVGGPEMVGISVFMVLGGLRVVYAQNLSKEKKDKQTRSQQKLNIQVIGS
jgi:hypothetical protein